MTKMCSQEEQMSASLAEAKIHDFSREERFWEFKEDLPFVKGFGDFERI